MSTNDSAGKGTPWALVFPLFAYAFSAVTALVDAAFRIEVFPHAGGFFLLAFLFVNPICGLIGLRLGLAGLKTRPRVNWVALALSAGLLAPFAIGAFVRTWAKLAHLFAH